MKTLHERLGIRIAYGGESRGGVPLSGPFVGETGSGGGQ